MHRHVKLLISFSGFQKNCKDDLKTLQGFSCLDTISCFFSPIYYHKGIERIENFMFKHSRIHNLTSLFQQPEILTRFFSLNACTNSPFNLSVKDFSIDLFCPGCVRFLYRRQAFLSRINFSVAAVWINIGLKYPRIYLIYHHQIFACNSIVISIIPSMMRGAFLWGRFSFFITNFPRLANKG